MGMAHRIQQGGGVPAHTRLVEELLEIALHGESDERLDRMNAALRGNVVHRGIGRQGILPHDHLFKVRWLWDVGGGRCREIGSFRRIDQRSEEHTSELQSLMRISYAVF